MRRFMLLIAVLVLLGSGLAAPPARAAPRSGRRAAVSRRVRRHSHRHHHPRRLRHHRRLPLPLRLPPPRAPMPEGRPDDPLHVKGGAMPGTRGPIIVAPGSPRPQGIPAISKGAE